MAQAEHAAALHEGGGTRLRAATEALVRAALLIVVLAVLWGMWEGWRWIGTHYRLTWPFPVNDVTMPHLHRIVQALFEPAQVNGPWLIDILWHASLFTAKEAALGFALGAVIG